MENQRDILQVQGINVKGYGTVPKLVMQDKRLTVEAKSIYAYFCSYAGAGRTAFPSREKITSDLGISKSRFYRHLNFLKEFGYIHVEQEHNKKFSRNIYTLVEQIPYLTYHQNKYTNNQCTQNEDTQNEDTQNEDTQNEDTNINIIKSFKSNKREINNLNINRGGDITGGDTSETVVAPNTPTPQHAPTQTTQAQTKQTAQAKQTTQAKQTAYGEFKNVKLTENEYNALVNFYRQDKTEDYINRLDYHIESKGAKYRSHYATIKKWIDEDEKKQGNQSRNRTSSNTLQQPRQNKFNNFESRDIDFEEIERKEREFLMRCAKENEQKQSNQSGNTTSVNNPPTGTIGNVESRDTDFKKKEPTQLELLMSRVGRGLLNKPNPAY